MSHYLVKAQVGGIPVESREFSFKGNARDAMLSMAHAGAKNLRVVERGAGLEDLHLFVVPRGDRFEVRAVEA